MKKRYLEKFYEDIGNSVDFGMPLSLPLSLIYKVLSSRMERLFKAKYNLLSSHIDVLAALHCYGHTLSPTELYDATVFTSGGMTKILKRLEELEYVIREDAFDDKRSKLVTITHLGIELIEDVYKESIFAKENIFSSLNEDEKIELSRLLKKVVFSLTD